MKMLIYIRDNIKGQHTNLDFSDNPPTPTVMLLRFCILVSKMNYGA